MISALILEECVRLFFELTSRRLAFPAGVITFRGNDAEMNVKGGRRGDCDV